MPTPAELLGTAICTALLGPTPPAASLQKHIDWAQAFLDNYAGGGGGHTVLSGDGAPGSGVGDDGDFYIDYTNWDIYGPKAGGAWPSGVSLVGPQGPAGADGADGAEFNFRGAYDHGEIYYIWDLVEHEGSSYVSLDTNIYSEPPSEHWQLIAAKGDQGEQGIQGVKGDPGDAPYDTLPVEWGEDSATPPAAAEQYAAGDAICRIRKFAQAEDQTLIFLWHVPENIDPEYPIIKYRVKGVKTESGAVADKALLFTLAGFCAGHGDAIGGMVGSAVDSELLDWSPSEGDVFFTDWSATAVVLAGLVAGGLAFLHLTRDNSVADNYPNPVGVILIEIQYNRLVTP